MQALTRRMINRNVTGCPDSMSWGDRAAQVLPRTRPIFVDVGANKGYSLCEFMQLWSQRRIAFRTWQASIIKFGRERKSGWLSTPVGSCGNCNDCEHAPAQPHTRSGGVAYLLELLPSNHELLRYVLEDLAISEIASVHHVAASNFSGGLIQVDHGIMGDERASILSATRQRKNTSSPSGGLVALQTVDDFLVDQGLGQAALYHVKIDTEGYDAVVLEGMTRTLSKRLVAILEFEVSFRGWWFNMRPRKERLAQLGVVHKRELRKLGDVISRLSAFGYECFWEAGRYLIPISGPCWQNEFEVWRSPWSNVVCAHEPEMVDLFRDLAFRQRKGRQRGS